MADLTRQILSWGSDVFGGMGGRKLMGNGPPDLPESLRRREPRMEAGSHDSLADQLLELHGIQEALVAAQEEARFKAAEEARRRRWNSRSRKKSRWIRRAWCRIWAALWGARVRPVSGPRLPPRAARQPGVSVH